VTLSANFTVLDGVLAWDEQIQALAELSMNSLKIRRMRSMPALIIRPPALHQAGSP
jgi:hypothetical protein